MRLAVVLLASLAVAACSDDDNDESPAPPPPAARPVLVAPVDAGLDDGGTAAITYYDPQSELHLDEGGSAPRPRRSQLGDHRALLLTLRSTPSGSIAAVDGVIVGRTPTYWETELNGREHEFVFTLPGHAMARYRFVPTTSGEIHGRLVKIVAEGPDGGPPAPGSALVPPPRMEPVPPPSERSRAPAPQPTAPPSEVAPPQGPAALPEDLPLPSGTDGGPAADIAPPSGTAAATPPPADAGM